MQQAPRACHLCTVTYLEGHEDFVSCTAISTDSKLVASGSYDAAIKLWFQEWPTALRSWSNAHLHTAGRKAHPHAFTYGCVSNTCILAKCILYTTLWPEQHSPAKCILHTTLLPAQHSPAKCILYTTLLPAQHSPFKMLGTAMHTRTHMQALCTKGAKSRTQPSYSIQHIHSKELMHRKITKCAWLND